MAILRGPIVYCGEQADNGTDLHQIHVDPFRVTEATVTTDTDTFPLPVNVIDLPATRAVRRIGKLYE